MTTLFSSVMLFGCLFSVVFERLHFISLQHQMYQPIISNEHATFVEKEDTSLDNQSEQQTSQLHCLKRQHYLTSGSI
jgi:hypothetical protein